MGDVSITIPTQNVTTKAEANKISERIGVTF